MRLMLLGEKLIAFRDSAGRVGVMDHRCPHRCASLFLGRNEEGGLRCVYHGWKFDIDGNCLDMPNVPATPDFKDKVKAKAYKAVERNGLVWVYMGARKEAPPLPQIEATLLPDSEVHDQFRAARMQLAAGARGRHRHLAFRLPARRQRSRPTMCRRTACSATRSPTARPITTSPTPSAARCTPPTAPAEPGRTYWRFANFLFPFWTQTPQGNFTEHLHNRAWVPMDDNHTMFVSLTWTAARRPRSARTSAAR